MKMIAGFLSPTSGTARVCGFDVQEQPIQAKRVLGYLPEGAPSYGEMTVRAFRALLRTFEAWGWLRLGSAWTKSLADWVWNACWNNPLKHCRKASSGVWVWAQAILHDPPVLILDKPTDGLDPNQKHEVRALIQSMARDKIILISTHILEEVHAVRQRAVIIARGKVLADAPPAELESRSRYHGAVSLTTANTVSVRC